MFRKLTAGDDRPKRKRSDAGTSRFELTQDWQLMKAALDGGLKPQEAVEVVLTPELKKKFNLKHRRTVTRFLQKYVHGHGMPYTVKSGERDLGTYFLVSYDVPVVSASRKRA
jgi:hypothetical protein